MRRLLPTPLDDVDLLDAYGQVTAGPPGRPHVRVNMVSSLDGAIAVGGRSGGLGGPADRRLFFVLRSLADVVLVGAGTVRAEGYGPVRLDPALTEARRGRGQRDAPPIAVVTRSCHLDWTAPFFTEAQTRPIIITVAEAAASAERGKKVADVVVAGEDNVELDRALAALGDKGFASVLGEGGPRLNAQLASGGLLDELCLTLSPRVVEGDGPRILHGPALAEPQSWKPLHLLEEDDFLFLRLGR